MNGRLLICLTAALINLLFLLVGIYYMVNGQDWSTLKFTVNGVGCLVAIIMAGFAVD